MVELVGEVRGDRLQFATWDSASQALRDPNNAWQLALATRRLARVCDHTTTLFSLLRHDATSIAARAPQNINFSIRRREKPTVDADTAFHAQVTITMSVLAYRQGRRPLWDDQAMKEYQATQTRITLPADRRLSG